MSEIERRPFRECFSGDDMAKKRARKSWFVGMPGRPLIKFFYLYFGRRGLLDGRSGFYYCCL